MFSVGETKPRDRLVREIYNIEKTACNYDYIQKRSGLSLSITFSHNFMWSANQARDVLTTAVTASTPP
jgi:hypothetical protein